MLDNRIGMNGVQFRVRVDHKIQAKGHVLANHPLAEVTKGGGEKGSVFFGPVFPNEEH
jgi:hypothetical protein